MAEQQIALIADVLPVGASAQWNGPSDPSGGIWLIEDGRALSRTSYPDLFNALGGTLSPFGLPTSTTFNIPDTRGRTSIGAGTGSGLTARTRGDVGGEEAHTLLTGEMPAHNHTVYATQVSNAPTSGSSNKLSDIRNTTGGGSSGTSETVGGGGSHNNMQPWVARPTIIKAL